MYEWDENKSQDCLKARGFDFSIVEGFDWSGAVIVEDTRKDYGEPRFRAFGRIDGEPFALAFTPRGANIRIISVRKMHAREVKKHGN